MQNEIYGLLATIQYHAKCNNCLYQKFTSNKIRFYIFCCKLDLSVTFPLVPWIRCGAWLDLFLIFALFLTLVIAYFLILTTENFHTHLSVIAPNNATISSTKMCRYGIPVPTWQQIGSNTLTTTTKLGVILLTESKRWFWSQLFIIMNYKRWKWVLISRLWCLLWVCHFPIGILGQVWYLIVSIPDLCNLTYFNHFECLWLFGIEG